MGPITRKNNYISGAIFKGEDAVRQKQSPTIVLPLPFASLGIPLVNGGASNQCKKRGGRVMVDPAF